MGSELPDHRPFDELHVVSDLHLGGKPGFQIFDQGPLLADTIRYLATGRPAEAHVGLVLNGDVVDFLAEPNAEYLDPTGATTKLARIFDDPAFRPVWDALADFVHTPHRRLVIAIGNHDVELALPPVRELLTRRLCQDDAEARGRLTFALDGTGFPALVGRARVFCAHGNDVDEFNLVDHEALRRLILAMNAGNPLPEWTPNAGTKLVIDVMNEVKKDYPLVDLLKPETRPVPAVLAALDPKQLGNLARLAPVFLRLTKDMGRRRMGLLSGEDVPTAPESLSDEQAAAELLLGRSAPARPRGDDLLKQAEAALAEGRQPLDVLERGAQGDTLGMMGMALDHLRGRSPLENLLDSLRRWLGKDTTFSLTTPDKDFTRLDASVGPEVDFLLAGHTHLARALRRTRGRGAYFNSGTWVRLIHLTERMLANAESFQPVYATFRQGSLAALDAHPELVLRRPTVVSVWRESGAVHGELRHATRDGQSVRLEPAPSTSRHSLPD